MQETNYHALLGVSPTATAADIEARYLALIDFLDPRKVPPSLRRWAETQSALVDEAYAALTETSDDDLAVASPARRAASPAQARSAKSRPAPPTKSTRHDEEPDDFDDEAWYEEDDEVHPEPPVAHHRSTPRAKSGAANAQPRWSEQGRSRGRQPLPARAASRRKPAPRDDRAKKLLLGLGVGLVAVVVLFFVAYQMRLGPTQNGADQADDKPIPIDQARYDQLVTIVRGEPQNFQALFELGQMTFEAAKYEESISWLEKALLVNPKDVQSLQDVGTASFNLGDREKAKEMWLKALEVDPNNAQTHWNLGFYYASQQPPDIDAALQEWQKVMAFTNPNDRLYQLAKTHSQQYTSSSK